MEWHENTFVDPAELMDLLRKEVHPRTLRGTLHVYHNVFYGREVVQCLSRRFRGRKAKHVATVLMRCGHLIRVQKGGEIGAALQSTREKLKMTQVFHDDDRMYMFADKAVSASIVILRVIKAEDLVPKSVQGLCNAFVIIQGPWGMLKTPVVPNTLHPEWQSTFLLILFPADQERATLGLELKDNGRMGARTCGRCVLSVDHLRLFLESRAQLNFPKSLSLELVQGSPVSFLDDTSGQESHLESVKVTHWYSNISGKFYPKRKKIATKLFLDVWMSSPLEPKPVQLSPSELRTKKMRPRAVTSEETTAYTDERTLSGSTLTKRASLLRGKPFALPKTGKQSSYATGEMVENTAKHAAFDTVVARFTQRRRRVMNNIDRSQAAIQIAIEQHGADFLFHLPRLAFEIIAHAGLSNRPDDIDLFGENREVIDGSQWTVVAPMIPRLCSRAFTGMVFDKLAEIYVGRPAFLEALAAHKPFRIPFEVFATYVSALESEWTSFAADCAVYMKFSNKRKIPDMGEEEMPLVKSEFVRGTVAQKASTGMLGTLWVTNRAVVYKRMRFIGASSVERKSLETAVSAQESNSAIHHGFRIGFKETEDKEREKVSPPRYSSTHSASSVEDVELVDWKSKRVDNYSVYRFSSVKDRNACLQVVKEIICFNRFCRLHLLPLVSASSRRSAEGLEQRAMALAYEMLLYSVLTYRAILSTQEESKAAMRDKKSKSKRRDKSEKQEDDAVGEDSDEDFDVKGVLDEDNKQWENVHLPFFYSMTSRYQKKKVHDISRGFLDLLDAVQEDRKETPTNASSLRKSVRNVFDTLAEYIIDQARRIQERARYGRLPWLKSLKSDAFRDIYFHGLFLFSPEQPAVTNAMNSEALLSAASALWIEDLRDEVARQVASSAKLHGLSQNVQLMRDLLEPVLELAHHFVEVYESITNWEDPVYNLILISALVILILNDAFVFVAYTLAFVPFGTTLIILQFRRLKEKGELPVLIIPQRRRRNILERYKDTRGKYRRLKQSVYKANLVLLKLRGLFTSEDARVTNTFLQFLAVLGVILAIVPSYILQLILVAHVFTSKMAFRQPMKRKIIEFIKLVWESIPHSPLFKPDGELVRMRGLINYADLET